MTITHRPDTDPHWVCATCGTHLDDRPARTAHLAINPTHRVPEAPAATEGD